MRLEGGMEASSDLLSWPRLVLSVAEAFRALNWRPFRAGAKTYYDVVQNGQYTFKVAEPHKQYGPIIRISPHELHVDDAAFFGQLYRQDAAQSPSAAPERILLQGQGEQSARRNPSKFDKLCDRISVFAESQETFNFGAAITAFVRGVAFDFITGKSYKSLDKDDLDKAMVTASSGSGQIWRATKHARFILPMLKFVPIDWIIKYGNHGTTLFFRFLKENMEDTKRLVASVKSASPDQGAGLSIVHEIWKSNLPESEKTTNRIFDDVATMAGAGPLRVALFHVFDNQEILLRLRAELATVETRDLKALEQLSYLKAILIESLRMSPALGTRMARIAPDRDLFYQHWRIPAGTPMGMTPVLQNADEALYPDARRFNPDRWQGSTGRSKLDKAFAPFSGGTRACLGMHLAWADMYLLVAGLVDRFDFRYPDARAEDFEITSDQFCHRHEGQGCSESHCISARRDMNMTLALP
ncbi:hypothetical protein EKO27_g9361 [Xylaria grammica]|uniref:Cytochrome P450 n=1 Tax=Xylaria grammica TaxID=363999 RepID=A0A439CU99_9PEZI|nr:hypothetical protein EKO27_g9361 [Xylaria grammica]